MPMQLKDIDKFEKLNNLIINVYKCTENGKEIWSRRISKKERKRSYQSSHARRWKEISLYSNKELEETLWEGQCSHGFVKKHLKDGEMVKHMNVCTR